MLRVVITEIDPDGRTRLVAEADLDGTQASPGCMNYVATIRNFAGRRRKETQAAVRGIDPFTQGPWDILFRLLCITCGWRNHTAVRGLANACGLHCQLPKARRPVRRLLRARRDYAPTLIAGAGLHMLPALKEALRTEELSPRPRQFMTRLLRARIGTLEMEATDE